ncbi:MAG TPA: SpoIIE family protein phosphatase [Stellaceae bacterium]|nr:SpoIIE family protein phosphatase [Stellaceae bacterium]
MTTVTRLIRHHPLLAALSDAALADLLEDSQLLDIGAGERLMSQGAMSDAVYLVMTGHADVTVDTAYGPVPVARLSGNVLIGEIGVFAGVPRTATVCACTPLTALRIEPRRFLALGRESPDLLFYVINQLGARIAKITRGIAFYAHALTALERHDFDPAILEELLHPVPELVDFAESFRRMAAQIVLRRAQREEMASAAAIQRAMLPPPWTADGAASGIELHADMRPAREVGGDFYDYFRLSDGRLCLALGDVSGKGVPASLFLALTRSVIRLVAHDDVNLAAGICRANELLCAENAASMFATVFFGIVDCATGTLSYCNCGHNPPLIIRTDGSIETLTSTGLPLAMLAGTAYCERKIALTPGDRLLLYTDGITEANNVAGDEFGEDRLLSLAEALRQSSARELVDAVLDRVAKFSEGTPQSDDRACLALVFA